MLDYKAQTRGCDVHLMIPDLIPFGDPQDGGDNWIAYKHKTTGDYFLNGPSGIKEYGPNFSSQELHNCNGSLIAEVIKVKAEFPVSTVTAGSTTGPVPAAAVWDDIATHPDAIPVKPDAPAKREQAKKVRGAVKTLEALKP